MIDRVNDRMNDRMNDAGKAFMGRGWAFPVNVEPDRGRVADVKYERDIKESIHIILSTVPGERVMRPDFGCGIHDLVFGSINTALLTSVRKQVTNALTRHEARIDVEEVRVDANDVVNGRLLVHLTYRIRATNQTGNFVYPFYFKEAF